MLKRRRADSSESEDERPYVSARPVMESGVQDVDPLDAFMAGISQEITQPQPVGMQKMDWDELAAEDPMDVYFEGLAKEQEEKRKLAEEESGSEDASDIDSDGNLGSETRKRSKFVPLVPPKDFSRVLVEPFEKDFFIPHPDIVALTENQVKAWRKQAEITVNGRDPARPIQSFDQIALIDNVLANMIRKSGFDSPTAIQAQALTIALSGRDLLGIAQTGSGKTVAYLFPVILHISRRLASRKDVDSVPLGLIVAPTRELGSQICAEAKKFCSSLGISVAASLGGSNMYEQELQFQGNKNRKPKCDLVVATPGRLIDHLKKGTVSLEEVSILVLDEADRMLQMGFEPQVRSLAGQIRPDRQCLLFSATFAPKVQRLARQFMKDHISISIGKTGAASKSVKQVIHVVDKEEDKFLWLMDHIGSFLSQGSVLIFALTKVSCEDIGKRLARVGIRTAVLHGDKLQHEREEIINSFKGRRVNCLIATDVAARGLDIQGLDVIINYELAKDLDSHVHRIGRTGRAGRQGTAHTLISKDKPSKLIPMLISSLQEAGQHVPDELWTLSRTVSSSTSKSASLTSSFVRPRQH